eukprot:GGOE01001953.1.p1 GENE.GGOE01001953.1~~GGOE01001953.1.p1  ORF type:complete len:311 (+),score=76.71 GGOE01001953.1:320-1252(+)
MVNGHNVRDPAVVGKVDALCITKGDYNRLHDGIFLNDVVVDFYLHHLRSSIPEAQQGRFRLLSPFFWAFVRNAPTKAAHRWEKDRSFFGHDFIFIPVNERRHWLTVVICFVRCCFEPLPANPEKLPHKPQIAVLDSMHTGAKFARFILPKLRPFLLERLAMEKRIGLLTAVPLEKADPGCLEQSRLQGVVWKVPKQPNRHDCGCYMLQFIEDLLTSPPSEANASASPAWVSEARARGKRREIMRLLDALREETELPRRRIRAPVLQLGREAPVALECNLLPLSEGTIHSPSGMELDPLTVRPPPAPHQSG